MLYKNVTKSQTLPREHAMEAEMEDTSKKKLNMIEKKSTGKCVTTTCAMNGTSYQ